jgi:hypothetical protein
MPAAKTTPSPALTAAPTPTSSAAINTAKAGTPARANPAANPAAQSPVKSPRKAAAPRVAAKPTARKTAAAKTTTSPKSVASKTTARPLAKATAQVAKAAKVLVVSKLKAPKKPKLVRDSFTMPKDEYQAIDSLKERSTQLKRSTKKSELLRAGIMALSAMDDTHFLAILAKVPALKTGRPSHS